MFVIALNRRCIFLIGPVYTISLILEVFYKIFEDELKLGENDSCLLVFQSDIL